MFWWLFKYCCLSSCNLKSQALKYHDSRMKSLVLILTFASKKEKKKQMESTKKHTCSCFILNCLQALTFPPVLQFEYSHNAWGRFEQ